MSEPQHLTDQQIHDFVGVYIRELNDAGRIELERRYREMLRAEYDKIVSSSLPAFDLAR